MYATHFVCLVLRRSNYVYWYSMDQVVTHKCKLVDSTTAVTCLFYIFLKRNRKIQTFVTCSVHFQSIGKEFKTRNIYKYFSIKKKNNTKRSCPSRRKTFSNVTDTLGLRFDSRLVVTCCNLLYLPTPRHFFSKGDTNWKVNAKINSTKKALFPVVRKNSRASALSSFLTYKKKSHTLKRSSKNDSVPLVKKNRPTAQKL